MFKVFYIMMMTKLDYEDFKQNANNKGIKRL